MTRHILDRPQATSRIWLGRAIAIEKACRPDRASLFLQRRKREGRQFCRSFHYLRFASAAPLVTRSGQGVYID